ncbi:argininosuccinate synthase [Sulfodiicoccus acidiphilus]|uniref:Argininosuccinate synthase n=1 Tax=Sulfodiicoccus acidiphilus TaxID=1670455 RepID=A0A348B0P4_9CREN|nr:argininosuccinate synthase [Sulfodiicoccus acidiphilus]GGT86183.1 argininosuccinate synthase [Sulfodiicoccus acidiphilus]
MAIKWLSEKYRAQVVTVTVDVGQEENFSEIEKRAYIAGAEKHYTIDAKEEFANSFVAPSIMMNALYEGVYPLSTALARPLIAEKVVEVAKKEGATHVAHGSTSKGNDQVRFDLAIKSKMPEAEIVAPARTWGMTRQQEVLYAKEKGIPIKEENKKFSIDENLWGRSIEGDTISDPYAEVPEEAFEWTKVTSTEPLEIELEFKEGVPITINGKRSSLLEIVRYLNREAGARGFGRVDHLENRLVGFKSREVYEVPAALLIYSAHQDLEKAVYTPLELRFKRYVDQLWSDLVYRGLWYEPLRSLLDEVGRSMNKYVEGVVKLRVKGGGVNVLGRRAKYSPYAENVASYERGWYPTDEMARGFIEIWGMHSLLANRSRA